MYNFSDAIAEGATVPLFYENRIPELQLTNEQFGEDLGALLESAEIDDDAEGALARRFATEYALITRRERLRTVARDLVRHFVGRGFAGKAMYVAIDKATGPMRNNSLMQTIARANWVFPDKENGLIVDYIGVFRNLERALAIYAPPLPDGGHDNRSSQRTR